ncbi:aminopeptidase Y [Gaeumannomyces tritici R3-111a-1]|uniref:Peptide hydrolase n=1 Tax=Gaeumannomyces tritici (strain R3-111a-1) TaxID=644352 RepID=J3P648_GAET3|nr:aminopeptidase Y [Gaeumannomyces tritici R3-111a-1]EJT72121.1 aminopeptidase Y [Gaeumannomyces tritici R3-111a-1]
MKTASLLSAGLCALGVLANEPLTLDKVEADIKTSELRNNLWHFNKIARENGGNRAFGLPGYEKSSDYVLERAQGRFHKQMDTYKQYFNHTFEQTKEIKLTGPDGEAAYVITLLYNHPTPAGGITAQLIDTPVNDATGSGCLASDWQGIDATGKIALVKRGTCAISDKLKLAKAHGALAVVLYNQNPGTPVSSATLGAENIGLLVPVATTSLENGVAWKARLAAGEALTVTVLVDSVFETRESWNIVAETKEGDPNNVVVLGAHLDGVQAGPGINDDGSGSTALLEIMGSFKKYSGFKNKVRFIWWGAEEAGLIGSLHYTSPSQLSEEEADKIRFYFNYDMIGSPFPEFVVYEDANPGGRVGGQMLVDYISSKGKPAEWGAFGTSSDYVGFLNRGIPSSGIFTGAGAPTDPCYHLACDDLNNIDWDALTINAKAAARAAAALALDLSAVPPRSKTTPAKRSDAASVRREFQRWANIQAHAEHQHTCAHSANSRI